MKTAKELELSLIVKESMIQQLKYRLSMYIEKCTMYENSNREFIERISKAIEYINKFDDIKAYYEYIDEDGYDEYNFDEDFKKDMLDILKGVD